MIPDVHGALAGWGVRPVLMWIGGRPVPSYSFFVTLGLIAALLVYWLNTRERSVGNNALYIALGAAVGGIVGSKVPAWIAAWQTIVADPFNAQVWLSGRTIVGGLIGGALGVWLVKRRLGIAQRLGNYLVPSLAIGIFFGRIGCLLAGCCYGRATSLPWGVDFGDHIARNPTQLYEALLMLGVFVYAQVKKDEYEPGELFRRFMILYFGWRFLIEFVRVNPVAAMGLTYYQIASLGVIAVYVFKNRLRSALVGLGRGRDE